MVTRPAPQGAGGLFFNAGNHLSPVQCGHGGKQNQNIKPPESTMSSPFLERAIALYGSAARLAERVGVTEAAISQARKRGQCSVKLAAAIVRDSNGVIDANVSELSDAK
jgi:Putative antitoxin of bacterial toxin-antitoxin system, YdaS/YdaT